MKPLSLSLANNHSLQQLFIELTDSEVSDTFMSSASAHGGLVHVFLSVASVSVVGISTLIENSPKYTGNICGKDGKSLSKSQFFEFLLTLKQVLITENCSIRVVTDCCKAVANYSS